MKMSRLLPLVAGLALVASCDRSPTQSSPLADVNLVDPYVLTFNATNGLPGEPFFSQGPGSRPDARGPGAPFPDSLKLTDAQKAQMQALRDAFAAAHASDLAALDAIQKQARDAIKAGKSRDELKAIFDTTKPILDRLKPAFDALATAIGNVLTPAQKAWIASHKPDGPPPRP